MKQNGIVNPAIDSGMRMTEIHLKTPADNPMFHMHIGNQMAQEKENKISIIDDLFNLEQESNNLNDL